MVTRSMVIGGAIAASMGLANSVPQLLILRTIQGAFSGTVAAARTLAAGIVPASRLGQCLGLMATAMFVGSSAGPLLGGFIADHFGFTFTFMITGVLLISAGISVFFFVQESFTRPSGSAKRGGLKQQLAVLFDFPQIRAVIVALFAVQVGQMAIQPVLPLFVKELVGSDAAAASTAGMILGAAAVTSAVAASVGGKLGDSIGHERVLAIAALVAGLLYLPQALVSSPWQLLALRALLGIFAGGIQPVAMAIIGLITPPESRGWVFGLTATAGALGNAVGPAAGALLANQFGLRYSFVFTALALTLAGVWTAASLRAPRSAAPSKPPTPGAAA
jgi:DHA1 family multidrug resistance protein-like MFS transporter